MTLTARNLLRTLNEDRRAGQAFLYTLEDKIEGFDVQDLSEIASLAVALIESKLRDNPSQKALLSQARQAGVVVSKLGDALAVRKR